MKFSKQAPVTALLIAFLALPAAAEAEHDNWNLSSNYTGPENILFTFAYSNPEDINSPHILFSCNPGGEPTKPLHLSFSFEDLDYSYIRKSKRNKKGSIHLQLGFWAWARSAAGPDVLRQETIDYDWPHRIWDRAHYLKDLVRIDYHGMADIARRIYSSESVSWTDRRTGETNSVEVGEKGRKAIEQILNLCGLAINESP